MIKYTHRYCISPPGTNIYHNKNKLTNINKQEWNQIVQMIWEYNDRELPEDLPPKLMKLTAIKCNLIYLPNLFQNYNLTSITISNNQLTYIPKLPTKLEILDCSNNQIREFEDQMFPESMIYFKCQNNKIRKLPIFPHVNLIVINVSNNLLSFLIFYDKRLSYQPNSYNYFDDPFYEHNHFLEYYQNNKWSIGNKLFPYYDNYISSKIIHYIQEDTRLESFIKKIIKDLTIICKKCHTQWVPNKFIMRTSTCFEDFKYYKYNDGQCPKCGL